MHFVSHSVYLYKNNDSVLPQLLHIAHVYFSLKYLKFARDFGWEVIRSGVLTVYPHILENLTGVSFCYFRVYRKLFVSLNLNTAFLGDN